jgi:phenylacetate-CoA ligase
VPYYAGLWEKQGVRHLHPDDPWHDLQRLPVLTKADIRNHAESLQSLDLHRRKWSYNTSGGSTGEPVRLIQDREYEDRCKALTLLYYSRLGYQLGQPIVCLWGSERDLERTQSPKARFFNWLTNTIWLNAFCMSPERMHEFVKTLNRVRPSLILAYTQSVYELAQFIEREGLSLQPQRVVVTTAGTLYPFMREKIAKVFGCRVYDQYGSREVSDIAFEIPGKEGLCVAPWGNFVEILDDQQKPVRPGEEGNIVVTCLTNYAMPLLRYWIGDRGALMPDQTPGGPSFQILKHVSGRNMDMFKTRNQTLIDSQYFIHLLYFRPWVWKFQVVQRSHDKVLFRIVGPQPRPPRSELNDIIAKTHLVMGAECDVDFEFPGELPPHPSGKFRYTISEVGA